MNSAEIFEQTLANGAYKLSAYFGTQEINQLGDLSQSFDTLYQRVPRFGGLVLGLVEHMNGAKISLGAVELGPTTVPGGRTGLHRDGISRHGLTLLVPIDGLRAVFFYADERQTYPDQLDKAQKVVYGLGDVMVLRQSMKVQYRGTDQPPIAYAQAFHAGISDSKRSLLTCDLEKRDTVILDPKQ